MYIGLSKDEALECFEFEKISDAGLVPKLLCDSDEVKIEKLITPQDTDCFMINRITLNNGICRLNAVYSYGVYIVINGAGKLECDKYVKEIKKGDYFFMPACLTDKFSITGNLQVVECY